MQVNSVFIQENLLGQDKRLSEEKPLSLRLSSYSIFHQVLATTLQVASNPLYRSLHSVRTHVLKWQPYSTMSEAASYEKIAEWVQKPWAYETLSKYRFNGKERILDIGCGGGEITAKMSEQAGETIGLDVSECMIEHAQTQYSKKDYPELSFIQGNHDELPQGFDLITLFNSLHWTADPKRTLASVYESLNSEGTVIIVGPDRYPSSLATAIQSVLSKEEWKVLFAEHSYPDFSKQMLNQEEMRKLLIELKFKHVRVNIEETKTFFPDRQTIKEWLSESMILVKYLPWSKRQSYLEQLVDNLMQNLPQNKKKEWIFTSYKLEAFAEKP